MRKLRPNAKRLLASFAIIGALCSLGASCRTAPPRQVLCLLDTSSKNPAEWYADCFDTGTDDDGFQLPLAKMDKYVCRSDSDEQILEDWIKRVLIKCGGNSSGVKELIEAYPLPSKRIQELLHGRN